MLNPYITFNGLKAKNRKKIKKQVEKQTTNISKTSENLCFTCHLHGRDPDQFRFSIGRTIERCFHVTLVPNCQIRERQCDNFLEPVLGHATLAIPFNPMIHLDLNFYVRSRVIIHSVAPYITLSRVEGQRPIVLVNKRDHLFYLVWPLSSQSRGTLFHKCLHIRKLRSCKSCLYEF